MYKIKLLILLLINFILTGCVSNNQLNDKKLSVSYIGGEYDGLLLSNNLTSYLNSFNMLDRTLIMKYKQVFLIQVVFSLRT